MAHKSRLNLNDDGFVVIPSNSPYDGELLGYRNDVSRSPPHSDDVLHQLLSLLRNKTNRSTFPLGSDHGALKKSLYCYHNPTILRVNLSFSTLEWSELDNLEYHISISHLMLSNLTTEAVTSMKDSMLTISHPVNPAATMAGDHYFVDVSADNSELVHFAFNTHFGSRVVVALHARSGPNILHEDSLLVEAPDGEVFIPIPKFSQPLRYKYCDNEACKLTFPASASYQVMRLDSSAPIHEITSKLYDGSPDMAEHWRLFVHRDVPVFPHARVGELPLMEFVQKLTLVYYNRFGGHHGRENASFQWYLDEERPCIEYAEHSNDVLVQVCTAGGEFRRWIHTPPLPSPEGEEHLLSMLKTLYPQAKHVWGPLNLVGYSAHHGDECILRTQSTDPVLVVRVVYCDRHFETRTVYATESTRVEALLAPGASAPQLVYLSAFGRGVCKVKHREHSCAEVGLTWSASLAQTLYGHTRFKDTTSVDYECTWGTLWTCTPHPPTFYVSIELPYGQVVAFQAWRECTVLWVKLWLAAKHGQSLHKQQLMHSDCLLDDRRTLGDCNITADTLILVVFR